jgi:hypothetical protein
MLALPVVLRFVITLLLCTHVKQLFLVHTFYTICTIFLIINKIKLNKIALIIQFSFSGAVVTVVC